MILFPFGSYSTNYNLCVGINDVFDLSRLLVFSALILTQGRHQHHALEQRLLVAKLLQTRVNSRFCIT